MEGALYKWSGYMMIGWSLKFFVLEKDSLCYYSDKVSSCFHGRKKFCNWQ